MINSINNTVVLPSSSGSSDNAPPPLPIPKTFSITANEIDISEAPIPPLMQPSAYREEEKALIAEALNPDATRARPSCLNTNKGYVARFDAWSRTNTSPTADLKVTVELDQQKRMTHCTVIAPDQLVNALFMPEQTGTQPVRSQHRTAIQSQLI